MSKKLWNVVGLVAAGAIAAGCVTVKPGAVVAPVAPTATRDDAARRLDFVKVERARAEARYAAGEQVCYTKFFTNNCLDKVREEHRVALANVRAIEIEAEHYQRKARADERDAALVESDKKFQEEQARLLANPPPPPKQEQPAPPPRPASNVDRVAEHDARLKRIAAQEQADAARREASVKAFEERKAASAQRLKDVERKMAETARAAAEKAVAEKAAAEKAAAAAEKAARAVKPAPAR
jgi:colicin import membrane protein